MMLPTTCSSSVARKHRLPSVTLPSHSQISSTVRSVAMPLCRSSRRSGDLARPELARRALAARLDAQELRERTRRPRPCTSVSSYTMKPPAPMPLPTASTPSYDERDVERPVADHRIGDAGEHGLDRCARVAARRRRWSMTSRRLVPSSTSPTPACSTSPTTVHTTLPGVCSVPIDRNQSAPADEDVRDVGERLDVVDEGRVRAVPPGPAPPPVRPRSTPAAARSRTGRAGTAGASGERLVALDHLEQRLLLAEEVLLGTGDDDELAVAADARVLHLDDGTRDELPLLLEARLERDERLLGVDHERGDEQPFDDLVRVGAQQGAVLERPRLALGAVARPRTGATPAATRTLVHLVPVGNPAPPRPRSPARLTSAMVASGPSSMARLQAEPADVGGEVLVDRTDGAFGQQVAIGHALP